MVIQCWADVVDGGPTLDERLVTAGMPRITKQFALFYMLACLGGLIYLTCKLIRNILEFDVH